jgi:hypothetical protein
MSKTIKYKCNNCGDGKEYTDNERPEWLEIGTEQNYGLFIKNDLRVENGIHALGNHSNIHFCSKSCFIQYFFDETE